MQHHVVTLTLAAGLVLGGSAAGAAGAGDGVSPSTQAVVTGTPGPVQLRDPVGRSGGLLGVKIEQAARTAPQPDAGPDPADVFATLRDSPVASLLAPLHLPGTERTLVDLANRPRTNRKFPRVPTAIPGGVGDPLAALPPSGYAGYGAGVAYHTDAALSGDRGSDIALGFAGASYSSAPLNARFDELGRRVSPPLKAASGFGQGNAAEVGVLEGPDDGSGSTIDARTEVSAPPNKAPVTRDQSDLNLSPLLDADLLHAEAAARSAADACVIGSDLAYGLGSATDSKIAAFGADESTVSTDGESPKRAASQTVTRTRLVPRPGSDRFGFLVETRQTIAPTTIRQGTPDEMTIEVAGEWILRVLVDGTRSRLDYGPDVDSPETTVLRVTRPEHPGKKDRGKTIEVANVTAQQLLGTDGVIVSVTDNEEIVVGELPRGIRDDHGSFPLRTNTRIAAATDVARVQLKDIPGADLRVGHMEAAAAIPAEGIACPGIGVAKRLDLTSVRPGDRFTWSIQVSNPNDCVLDKVKVVDTITATPGVRYRVLSSDPPAKQLTDGSVTFEGIGPLRQGQSTRLFIDAAVDQIAVPGSLHDVAVADGVCGPERRGSGDTSDTGQQYAPAPMSGRAELTGPNVGAVRLVAASPAPSPSGGLPAANAVTRPSVDRERAPLAATGGLLGVIPAWLFISGGSLLRRLRKRRA